MLGNQAELWESLLAAMKLGAVIIPATTLLTAKDITERIERGGVSHVIANAADAASSARARRLHPHRGRRRLRLAVLPRRHARRRAFVPDGPTRAGDTLLLYFTSGTTSQPKLVEHTHASYPVGHLSTMFWIGLRPGDVHLNVSSPGWAKHAWSNVFAPWNAGATVLIHDYQRFSAAELLRVLRDERVTTFCAPPTVWRMLIQEDLAAWKLPLRAAVGRRRAAQPGDHRPGGRGVGPHDQGRLRPDRDHRPDRQRARRAGQARLDGPAAAGLRRGADRPGDRRAGRRRRDLPAARPPPAGPHVRIYRADRS